MATATKTFHGIAVPRPATLARYGLSLADWRRMVRRLKGACWVCLKVPSYKRLVIDHEHVAGWKRMPAPVRRRYVRGVLCITCNHYILGRYATPEKLHKASVYLDLYQKGLNPWLPR